jgi:type II secretory pathway component GspD/PulD (secretin)
MKTITALLLVTGLVAGLAVRAAEPPTGAPTNDAPSAPVTNVVASPDQPPPPPAPPPELATNAVGATAITVTNLVADTNAPAGTNAVAAAPPAEPPVLIENGTNGLRLNFHNAPLNLVLDYLSDAAGFIINRDVDVRGTVDVQGKNLTKDEAVSVLNTALKRNGYAVTRNGRILTIIAQDTAKTGDLPIEVGPGDPDAMEKGSEMVTRIIPVKYASVSQLVPNLELLLPSSATLSANESANSLILVATRTDIKRMLTIINALDTSISSVSSIKVIPLRYADAKDTATLIGTLFASQGASASTANSGRPNFFSMFGGGRGGGMGGPGGFGGGRGGGGSSGGGGGAAAKNVVAVGDDRSNSIIISAPSDLLATIEDTVKEIDQEVSDVTEMRVFTLLNADPSETADQLATLFPDPTSATSGGQSQMPFFLGRGTRGGGATATSTAAASDRAKKIGRVLAVPDPRTSSVIVTASKTLMPEIAEMISQLDANKGRKEVVGYYDLRNADPQDVQAALQDLFNRNTSMRNNNQNALLGNNSPLTKRIQNNSQTSGTKSSSFGGSSSSGGRSSGGSISGF